MTAVTAPNGSDSSTCWDGRPHQRELFISALSISYLSGCQKSTPHCPRGTDWPNLPECFSSPSNPDPELCRRAVLLSTECKKLVCVVRWVECDVRTVYAYFGYFIRATGNDKWNIDFDAGNPPASPRLVGTTSGYLCDHYTSHDVGKLQLQNLRI